ncbi:YqjK family protein [Halomonas beimenensis]|uniref:YqjK-like protein n=1 Tax=Halomonas beimenensis TaxID=475662 RepID=A0A291P8V5_9GAMM|nr:YqjK family protein [Halomonas beimenensis]ATJ83297.1 hypothetical protein BEI_2310 [Halomonas beimenensis]
MHKAKAHRQARKAALEATIEQQRVDLLVAAEQWRSSAHRLDAGWQALRRYRSPALAAGALLLWAVARRPGAARRLGRRALLTALAARRLRRWLPRSP